MPKIVNIAFNLCKDGAGDTIYQKPLFSTFLRAQSSRRCSPHGGSTSLRARCPHGVAVFMGSTSPGARPPYALAVFTALQSSWAPRPYGLPSISLLALQDYIQDLSQEVAEIEEGLRTEPSTAEDNGKVT